MRLLTVSVLTGYVEMTMKRLLLLAVTTVPILTGCVSYVTKENSSSFATWELCTLLYDPQSLYSDWISMENEDSIIRTELASRGLRTKADCSVESQAKSKCDDYGFKAGTTDYANCRIDVEQHIEEMKQLKKAANESRQAAEAAQAQQIINNAKLEQLRREQQRQQLQIQQQQQWQILQQQYPQPTW